MQRRRASVFLTDKMIYASGMAKTVPGFHIISGPVVSINRDSDPAAVGDAVLRALGTYKEEVPAPDPRRKSKEPDPLLKATGFKSWKAVEKAAILLLIEEVDGQVRVIPNVRDHHYGGYAEKSDLATAVSPEPTAIGHAVLEHSKICG